MIEIKIGNKAAMEIWLTALASVFIVALIWNIFNQVLYSPYGLIPTVNASLNDTAPHVNITDALSTMNIIQTVWNNWPLVAIFSILLWAFARSISTERREY